MVSFTTAEDYHIIRLKERTKGSWTAIHATFAGIFLGTQRKAGSLQVRYSRYLRPGKEFRSAALVFPPPLAPPAPPVLAPAVPAPPVPAPAGPPITRRVTRSTSIQPPAQSAQAGGKASTRRSARSASAAAPSIAAQPPAQSAQAGGRASTRRSARSATPAAAPIRRQKKVTARKTRSSAPPPAPAPTPAPVSVPVAPVSVASSASDHDDGQAPSSDFDPPSQDIKAYRKGTSSRPIFPPRYLSEISDFDPPSTEEFAARRGGHGDPITSFYPPDALTAAATAVAAEEEGEDDDEVEMDVPARRTRGAVKSGRVVRPQTKGKGKGKAKAVEKKVRAPAVKKQQELREKLAGIKWEKEKKAKGRGKAKEMVEQGGWDDDRWADLTPW
ncbi:hypothetical protein E6O75_ATG09746 [Venturia nashicola]|uniref:Uncharacterized protein n=1 Tax=Venturia nashicola TaxID=86259 RepID=A0A4Z1P8K5_9PEZI|nr:hypothetical protein E6O75_ATG09746 [Venturia nashicola]